MNNRMYFVRASCLVLDITVEIAKKGDGFMKLLYRRCNTKQFDPLLAEAWISTPKLFPDMIVKTNTIQEEGKFQQKTMNMPQHIFPLL